jgi:hypothetical protein
MKINTALFAVLNLEDVLHWKMLLNTSTSFSNFHLTAGEKADLRIKLSMIGSYAPRS